MSTPKAVLRYGDRNRPGGDQPREHRSSRYVRQVAGLAPRHRQRQHGAPLRARRPRRPQRQGHDRPGRRVPAGPARLHAAGQDHRHRPARRRAAPHRRGAGHRQDDDGPPDGAQRRVRRPGQRAVHLLRARRAVPAQPPDRDGVGARAPAPQDRRDQDPGRPQGDPRDVDGRGRGERPAGQQPAPPAVARPDRPLRPEPVPDARLADGQHGRQHPQARPGAPAAVGRPAAGRLRRLPAEGARRSPSRRTRPRRSPTSSTGSRTSRCPRTCRWSASWPPTRRA